jgi:anaerobic ribonucleoside-triphosphate reductase activating protein
MNAEDNIVVRLHRFLPRTRAEGPGVRACLWVQGCSIKCAGCAVPWTWTASGGTPISVNDIEAMVLAEPGLDGVTFLGGEPFDQAAALSVLGRRLRRRGLGIVTFSGYRKEDLASGSKPEWLALLAETDLLIDGPYMEPLHDLSRPWVGSLNKRYHFLTSRYSSADVEPATHPNRVEVRVSADGTVRINGMASQTVFEYLRQDIKAITGIPPVSARTL